MEDGFSNLELMLREKRWQFRGERNGWRKWTSGNGRAVIWFGDGGVVTRGKIDEWVLKKMGNWGPKMRRSKRGKRGPNVVVGMRSLAFLADKYK